MHYITKRKCWSMMSEEQDKVDLYLYAGDVTTVS